MCQALFRDSREQRKLCSCSVRFIFSYWEANKYTIHNIKYEKIELGQGCYEIQRR